MVNAVYIIGNGFDIRMGMPTGYSDFLEYYEKSKATSEEINAIKIRFFQRMHQEKAKGKNRWADLEVALGDFTKGETNIELFKAFYRDINTSLRTYLRLTVKDKAPKLSNKETEKFWNDLRNPGQYLSDTRKIQFDNAISFSEISANVISFNYTATVETLLANFLSEDGCYRKEDDPGFVLWGIKHIHRTLNDNGVLFGVDNSDQIANQEFQKDLKFLNLIVKPYANQFMQVGIDDDCRRLIAEAHVIYIFGTSLGETDQCWWKAIGNKFRSSDCILWYFNYEPSLIKEGMLEHEYIHLEMEPRMRIMERMGIFENEVNYRQRIFVVNNDNMFSFHGK